MMDKFYEATKNRICPNCNSRDTYSSKASEYIYWIWCNQCDGIPAFCDTTGKTYLIDSKGEINNNCPHCGEYPEMGTHMVAQCKTLY